MFVVFVTFTLLYILVQRFADFHLMPLRLTLPGENLIPFLPPTILFYLSAFIMPPLILYVIPREQDFMRSILAFVFVGLIHFTIFILFPVTYELRQPIYDQQASNIFMYIVGIFYHYDSTLNSFPSMHVSYAMLSYFCVRAYKPQWARLFFILAIGVACSTVFIKQHYVLDVVVAVFLAGCINRWFLMNRFLFLFPRPSLLPKNKTNFDKFGSN